MRFLAELNEIHFASGDFRCSSVGYACATVGLAGRGRLQSAAKPAATEQDCPASLVSLVQHRRSGAKVADQHQIAVELIHLVEHDKPFVG
jgi:hypothetical protein